MIVKLMRNHYGLRNSGALRRREPFIYSGQASLLYDCVWTRVKLDKQVERSLATKELILVEYPHYPIPRYLKRREY